MIRGNTLFIILIFITLICSDRINAQEADSKRFNKSISLSLFDEHIAFPFSESKTSPTHLGTTVSYELSKERDGIYQFTHIFQAGYYYHKGFNQALFVAWKPKFELRLAKTIDIHTILGIGYAHSFPTEATFIQENGKYKQTANWGKPHFMPSIGVGGGLYLRKWLDMPLSVYMRYETFSLAPYALKTSTPLTINTMLSFGVTYYLNKK